MAYKKVKAVSKSVKEYAKWYKRLDFSDYSYVVSFEDSEDKNKELDKIINKQQERLNSFK